MKCPGCADTELLERMTKSGVLVDQCPKCQGIWLDRGEIYLFSKNPRKLESLLSSGLADPRSTERHCPHCEAAMQVGHLMKRGLEVNQCSECEGLWFDKGELQQAIQLDRRVFQVDVAELRREPGRRPRRRSRGRKDAAPAQVDRQGARARVAGAAMPRLPNLFLRSASTLVLLYALLGTALIALVEFAGLMPELAVGILTVIVIGCTFGAFGMSHLQVVPAIAKDVLDTGVAAVGLLLLGSGIGGLIGTLLLPLIGRAHIYRALLISLVLFALVLMLFAWSSWFWVSWVLILLIGLLGIGMVWPLATTIVQLESPSQVRGRVMGILHFIPGFHLLGAFPLALAAGQWGWGAAITGAAIVSLSVTVWFALVRSGAPKLSPQSTEAV